MGTPKKKREEELLNAGIVSASADVVQRYGSAVKEHVVAYTGIDNETGTTLNKSLKSIYEEKVNPDYKSQNLKQQAGFSAEVKDTARANAERIINGSNTKKVRTDDLGMVNDPLYDHVVIDSSGNIITGSESQMKFVGADPKEALHKLASKKFAKYLDNDVKIEVPSDYYEGILREADAQIAKLQKQADAQYAKGNTEMAARIEKRIADYQKIKKNLRKSSVSTDEAMFARLHPKLSTARDIAKVSHRAGLEAAQTAAIVSGSISIIQNLVAVVKGEAEAEDAVKNVAKATAASAALGYGTGFAGASIKGVMQNAGSETIRALSKTNLSGIAVNAAMSATKTMGRYFKGEISGIECFEELGEQGTGMISSSLFTMVGQTVIPNLIVGGLIGGMVGYAIASASYGTLMAALKEKRLAHEKRIKIEQICEEHIKMITVYRTEIERTISIHLVSSMDVFHAAFDNIKESLSIGDVDGFIAGTNAISSALGRKPQFGNLEEFNEIMSSGTTLKI